MTSSPASDDLVVNGPEIGWGAKLGHKAAESHKYDHGHVVIFGSRRLTGAGCLAALSALRMGAGLCTVAAPSETANVYRSYCASLMVEPLEEMARFKDAVRDPRRNSIVIGPGAGLDNPGGLKKAVLDAVQAEGKDCIVLDADALSVFADDPKILLKATHGTCVLTPHEGEFARIFPNLTGSRSERAEAAAIKSHAIVVLKGHETVIASPQGGSVINTNGTGWLASAGTGDVLAGMIAGLAARNLESLSLFGAVCAAVWMHGEAGRQIGPGLISEDIPLRLPVIWGELLSTKRRKKLA